MEIYDKKTFELLKKKKDEQYIVIAKIQKKHGLLGEVKIESFSDDENPFEIYNDVYIKDGSRYLKVNVYVRSYVSDKIIAEIYTLDNINLLDKFNKIQNMDIFILKNDLKQLSDDEYYISDLLKMEIYDENNMYLGKITDVLTNTNTPVLEVNCKKRLNKTILIPLNEEFVGEINKKEKKVFVEIEKIKDIIELGY